MQYVTLDAQKKNAICRVLTRLALLTLLCGCETTTTTKPVATPAPTTTQPATTPTTTTQPATKLTPPGPVVKLSGEGWEMIVHPSIGRITSFGRPGGRNLLWVNESPEPIGRNKEWIDWGGDKVWPSPQDQWPVALGRKWPPGSAYEGGKWTELPIPSSFDKNAALRIGSEPVREIGVKIERSIERASPGWAHVDTTITRTELRDVDTHVWNVTQVRVPEFAILSKGDLAFSQDAPIEYFGNESILDRTMDPRLDIGVQIYRLDERVHSVVLCGPSDWGASGSKGRKVGVMGRWVAAVYPEVIFVQAIDQARPGRYADRSNVQVFASSTYWELETLGRSDALDVGATRALRVRWGLLDRVAGEELPEMVKRIQSAVEAK